MHVTSAKNVCGDELYTSPLTLGQILIKPLEANEEGLVQRYEAGCCRAPLDREKSRRSGTTRTALLQIFP